MDIASRLDERMQYLRELRVVAEQKREELNAAELDVRKAEQDAAALAGAMDLLEYVEKPLAERHWPRIVAP
jgi:3-oxoacyl-ACP reductase-like protein